MMRIAGSLAILFTGCQAESAVEPFGLELREQPVLGSVAEAIRSAASAHPACPESPAPAGPTWAVRTVDKPAVRVALPPHLMEVRAPGGEVTFFAPDMTAGAFVIEAPGLAHLDPTVDSVSPPPAATTCHLQAGAVVSVVYLISQAPPALRGDSVHIAFLQVAGAGDVAIRAGAFATTRALRDSIVGALLAFQPW